MSKYVFVFYRGRWGGGGFTNHILLQENILPWNLLFSVRGWSLLKGSLCAKKQTLIWIIMENRILNVSEKEVYFILNFMQNISHTILLTRQRGKSPLNTMAIIHMQNVLKVILRERCNYGSR